MSYVRLCYEERPREICIHLAKVQQNKEQLMDKTKPRQTISSTLVSPSHHHISDSLLPYYSSTSSYSIHLFPPSHLPSLFLFCFPLRRQLHPFKIKCNPPPFIRTCTQQLPCHFHTLQNQVQTPSNSFEPVHSQLHLPRAGIGTSTSTGEASRRVRATNSTSSSFRNNTAEHFQVFSELQGETHSLSGVRKQNSK